MGISVKPLDGAPHNPFVSVEHPIDDTQLDLCQASACVAKPVVRCRGVVWAQPSGYRGCEGRGHQHRQCGSQKQEQASDSHGCKHFELPIERWGLKLEKRRGVDLQVLISTEMVVDPI